MPLAIQEVDPADPLNEGRFLMMFDPNAHDGWGAIAWTERVEEAIQFATHEEAILFWRQQPSTRPLREDGEPNRPLTAYTISFTEVGAIANAKRAANAAASRGRPTRVIRLSGASASE